MEATVSGSSTCGVVITCLDLTSTISFFVDMLEFRLNMIKPADGPREAVLNGHGLMIYLIVVEPGQHVPSRVRIVKNCPGLDAILRAPNGTMIEIVHSPTAQFPSNKQEFVISTAEGDSAWNCGRAGMMYRDLLPNRQGGRYICSLINIPDGGPVPDYVHFHRIRFQMIYCYRGWVKVVYEDQGDPFLLQPGDCVIQPPEIRHRVLESSSGLTVIEIGCPAEHETFVEHDLKLPNGSQIPTRNFLGQRFVKHVDQAVPWQDLPDPSWSFKDFKISEATAGLATVRTLRPRPDGPFPVNFSSSTAALEFVFVFVLEGQVTLKLTNDLSKDAGAGACADADTGDVNRALTELLEASSAALPAGTSYQLEARSADCKLLLVEVRQQED